MKIVVTNEDYNVNDSTAADSQVGEDRTYVYKPLETLNRFLKLHQCIFASFSENLEHQHDITLNEFRGLMMVGQMGVTASHEIAEATGMRVMAVSRTIVALEKRGLITVKIDPENRRRKLIRLSKQGKNLFDKMMPTTNRVALYMFESLRLDEILSFDHYLKALIERVTEEDEDGELLFVKNTRAALDGQ